MVRMAEEQQTSKWYALRVLSGKEDKVVQLLERERKSSEWGRFILQIFVPKIKVYQQRKGKKVQKEKAYIPGYIFIEVSQLTNELIQGIRSIPGVVSFLTDAAKKPVPLSEEEIERLIGKTQEELSGEEKFYMNKKVVIKEGPFQDFKGVIEEVMEDKKKLRVVIPIFNRNTPVEVSFHQVEKVNE